MKLIKKYEIFENAESGLNSGQKDFLNRYTGGIWEFDSQTGLVNIDGDFIADSEGLLHFNGIRFGEVTGNFYCQKNRLFTLQGAPQKVGFHFYCNNNRLNSLEGAPQEVGGSFDCDENLITSLSGAPKYVGGSFYCNENQLSSLEGAPQVCGDFYCTSNRLTSLIGAPKKIGNFDCASNRINSLRGAPQEVGGWFSCTINHLDSLVGAPKKVNGFFDCTHNHLTSLSGAPQVVGEGFICDRFSISNWSPAGWTEILFDDDPRAAKLIVTLLDSVDSSFENFIDAHINSNPLDLDLLDPYPEIKAGVLKRTGLEDVSDLARAMRKGLI